MNQHWNFLVKNFNSSFIGLLALLVAFIGYKIQYLSLPFFWDEAWVYAPAVFKMEATGLSLLPTALDPELSRGHPLLFHYLGAAWMRVLGTSISSAHAFPLFLAIVLLVAFFMFVKSATKSSLLAVFGTLLLAVQPIFLAQSGLLLPEMQLALFAFVAFVAYVFNRVFIQALFLAAALLTKESALVVALAFLATDFLLLFLKQIDGRGFLKRLPAIVVPILILGAFLIKQKIDLGWFFFPEHIGLIDTNSALVLEKLERYAAFVFVYQGRIGVTIAFVAALFFVLKRRHVFTLTQLKTFLFIGFFTIGFLVFSALNFYSDRYMLILIPFFLSAFVLAMSIVLESKKTLATILSALVIFQLIQGYNLKGNNDHNMSYVDAIKSFQIAITFAQDSSLNMQKSYAPFLLQGAMKQSVMGYVVSDTVFKDVSAEITAQTKLAFFANIDDKSHYEEISKSESWQKLHCFEVGKAWVEIYQKN